MDVSEREVNPTFGLQHGEAGQGLGRLERLGLRGSDGGTRDGESDADRSWETVCT